MFQVELHPVYQIAAGRARDVVAVGRLLDVSPVGDEAEAARGASCIRLAPGIRVQIVTVRRS